MITVHLAESEVAIEGVVYKADETSQQWQTTSSKPSLQETPIIFDLGGHFIWASNTSPFKINKLYPAFCSESSF